MEANSKSILLPLATATFVSAAVVAIVAVVAFVIPVIAIVSLAAVSAIGIIEDLFSLAGLDDNGGAIRMVLESFVVSATVASFAALVSIPRLRSNRNLLSSAVIGLVFDFVGWIKDMRRIAFVAAQGLFVATVKVIIAVLRR